MAKLNNDEVHEIKRLMKAWEDGGYSIALTRQLTMLLQKMLNEYFCKGETENKRSLMPMIEAYSVEWYEEGVAHCPQFTDIENAIGFADKVMHDKPKVDMVTIRRSEW